MFYVNPLYEPSILTNAQKIKQSFQIQSLLLIPKDSRSNENKKKIYEYFIQNPHLRQIERSKSLRGRILCVGQIQLINKQQYVQTAYLSISASQNQQIKQDLPNSNDFIVLQIFQHDSTLAVLRTQIRDQIIMQNQSLIKHQMHDFKKFTFLKHFLYHELLYLAHFVEKVKKVPYKHFVFDENQKAEYVYFIEEGQFQVFKNVDLLKQKSIKKIKTKKQTSPFNKYLENQESPYKAKSLKINKNQLSKIEGGAGQSFGQIQLFLSSQKRCFSLKCNSLTSKLFKINFKYFMQIFADNTQRFKKLKKQYFLKYQNNLQQVKINSNIKERIGSPENKLNLQLRQINSQSKKLSSIIFQMNKYKTFDKNNIQGPFVLSNNSLTIPLNDLGAKKNSHRYKKIFSQNSKQFNNHRYGPEKCEIPAIATHNFTPSLQFKGPNIQSEFFPPIAKNHSTKNGKPYKNNPFALMQMKRNKKVKGLVDISIIIQQKQQLYNSLSGVQNPQFSFYKLDQKHAKRLNYQKSQLGKIQMIQNSPVHSNHYMKNLLKRSLKKSGYLPQNLLLNESDMTLQNVNRIKTNQLVNTSSLSILEETQTIKYPEYSQIQQKSYSLSKQVRESLISNDFDKFFHKI